MRTLFPSLHQCSVLRVFKARATRDREKSGAHFIPLSPWVLRFKGIQNTSYQGSRELEERCALYSPLSISAPFQGYSKHELPGIERTRRAVRTLFPSLHQCSVLRYSKHELPGIERTRRAVRTLFPSLHQCSVLRVFKARATRDRENLKSGAHFIPLFPSALRFKNSRALMLFSLLGFRFNVFQELRLPELELEVLTQGLS